MEQLKHDEEPIPFAVEEVADAVKYFAEYADAYGIALIFRQAIHDRILNRKFIARIVNDFWCGN